MNEKSMIIKLIQFLVIIPLYYIAGEKSIFLYSTTLSLYNIYLSCFSHISLKETYKKNNYDYSKFKILKYVIISITIICLLFTALSIVISNTINIFLNIKNTLLPYLIMSISIITEPLIKILLEHLESYKKPKLSSNLLNMYYILEITFLLLISIITLRIFNIPIHISVSLLYLSKIFSFIIILVILYISFKKIKLNLDKTPEELSINYKNEVKEILKNNSHKSIINIVKNSYYYISIIILYLVLSTRYNYNISIIEQEITFIYFYALIIINLLVEIIMIITKNNNKNINIIKYIYITFQNLLTSAIIISIIAPLMCKIIFGQTTNSIYLMLLSFLAIFISLFNITFDYIKNQRLIYISLITGIVTKLIITIPLINSFYRMGYSLAYGDIISTMICMFISVIINYIYIKTKNPKEKTLEQILTTLYESLILGIILVLLQFILPIKTDSYLKTILTLIVYIFVSVTYIKFKKKKRG